MRLRSASIIIISSEILKWKYVFLVVFVKITRPKNVSKLIYNFNSSD